MLHSSLKDRLDKRLQEFKNLYRDASEYEIFKEFVFCIFTPQSSAKSCWKAVQILDKEGLITDGTAEQIAQRINIVRFRNNKARYLVLARNTFYKDGKYSIKPYIDSFNDKTVLRNELRLNIKGWGLKEASHFLRNIGFGERLAILDRHILRNMVYYGVIPEIPGSISDKTYHELEMRLLDFSEYVQITPDRLDIILWYMQTNEIFK